MDENLNLHCRDVVRRVGCAVAHAKTIQPLFDVRVENKLFRFEFLSGKIQWVEHLLISITHLRQILSQPGEPGEACLMVCPSPLRLVSFVEATYGKV